MRVYKRRVWLDAVMVLSLLAGAFIPASISADTVPLSTSAPDLIINTITWSPEIPSIGDKVTFTVTIKNQGGGQAGSSHVAYYIDDTYQTSASVNPIDPSATATETFTWTAQAGSHAIKAVADSYKKVTESDETNNSKTFAFSILAPDLIIETITWSPANPSIGDQVAFTVNIKNQGSVKVGTSHVDLYIDGSSRGYRYIQRIDAGATVTETFNWTALSGSHTIKAVADVLNQVTENGETNNDKTVIYSTAAPDLIINTITWSPANPSENTTVTFTVTIKNQGSGKATHSYVAYYIDDTYQTSAFVNPINPSATATETFTWTAQAGSHAIKAVADSYKKVTESDETNNDKTIALPSLAPDLIIQNITWSPASPLVAHSVTFTVTIKNQGKTRAGCSRVYFYIDDAHRWQQDIQEIDAGATVTKTFPRTALAAGSHTVRAIADAENYVIEGNESNNVKTATISPSLPDPSDLVVQNIVWSPENPVVGNAVTFTVTVKNQGSGRAGWFSAALYIDDTYLAPSIVSPLSHGATATINFSWEARAGPHTIKAIVDSNNIITESDETNNEKAVALSTSAPDLVIQDITWSPVSPSIGDMVTFTVTIKNQGSVRASRSHVAYYIDDSSRGYHDVQEIDPGATATKTFTWTAQTGFHTIKVVADMESQIPENDESNNEKTVTLPAPDLIIDTITWSPLKPSKDDTVTFSVTIRNLSSGRADSSGVYFYIDGSSKGQENVQGIDAGATITKTFTWTAQTGSHTIKAVADGENQITESDESNNEKTVIFSVFTPLSVTPAPASASKPIPVSTTSLKKQEAGVQFYSQTNEVPPEQDAVFNPSEEPSPIHSSEKGIWLSWWFILAVVVLGGIAIVVILRLRQRPH